MPDKLTPEQPESVCPAYAARIPNRRYWFGKDFMRAGSGSDCRNADCPAGFFKNTTFLQSSEEDNRCGNDQDQHQPPRILQYAQ